MPLYQMGSGKVVQIKPGSFSKERDLQRLFEANLEMLLGVRFIASEFTTGDRQRGRIDTLGLDQDGNPTIIEFKKTESESPWGHCKHDPFPSRVFALKLEIPKGDNIRISMGALQT